MLNPLFHDLIFYHLS